MYFTRSNAYSYPPNLDCWGQITIQPHHTEVQVERFMPHSHRCTNPYPHSKGRSFPVWDAQVFHADLCRQKICDMQPAAWTCTRLYVHLGMYSHAWCMDKDTARLHSDMCIKLACSWRSVQLTACHWFDQAAGTGLHSRQPLCTDVWTDMHVWMRP